MPGGRDQSPFGGLWDSIVGEIAGVVDAARPVCESCDQPSYLPLRCIHCNGYACHAHGFFNLVTKQMICRDCANAPPDIEEGHFEAEEDLPECGYPWTVLGIDPTRDVRRINRAFALKSSKCHDDATDGNLKDKTVFAGLQAAREYALELARGEDG